MVARQHRARSDGNNAIEALDWPWPVADGVAEIPDRIDLSAVVEHGFERDEIGVDVRNEQDSHLGIASSRVAWISNAAMSEGVTPESRPASPNVIG